MAIPVFEKLAGEVFSIGVDFDGQLPSGTTVSSGVVAAYDKDDAVVSGDILVGTTATISGTIAKIKLASGNDAGRYKIRFAITLSNSDVLQEDTILLVKE